MKLTIRFIKKGWYRLIALPGGLELMRYLSNKLLGLYYKSIRSTKVAMPSTLMIEVTNRCNLKCATCPRETSLGSEMNQGAMPLAQAKRIIDEACPYIDSIGLAGLGESFLYTDLEALVRYIKSKNKGISIFLPTNATLPTIVSQIEAMADVINTIQISIDGINDTYNQIRQNANYALFENNLKRIVQITKAFNIEVRLNFVILKENHNQMADVLMKANEIGLRYVSFTPFNAAASDTLTKEYYDFFFTNEFKDSLQSMQEVSRQFPHIKVESWQYQKSHSFKNCIFPWSYFYITWDGYLVPCCAKPFPKLMHFGNVFENGLLSCLNGNSFRRFRKQWHHNALLPFCENCHNVHLK